MPSFYLNSYAPLIASAAGRAAVEKHRLPPFVDGSIRREPDLEHEFPAISCLCRADKFAPRLRAGDVVAYLTRKLKYFRAQQSHHRLTAVLQVREIQPSHDAAADWYRARSLPLPNNCMVDGNPAKPLDQSHQLGPDRQRCSGDRMWRLWDSSYRKRARAFGNIVLCGQLFHNLESDAPIVENSHLNSVFGCVPSTQNPGKHAIDEFWQLMAVLGLANQIQNVRGIPFSVVVSADEI
jgi:hypothetical protein